MRRKANGIFICITFDVHDELQIDQKFYNNLFIYIIDKIITNNLAAVFEMYSSFQSIC